MEAYVPIARGIFDYPAEIVFGYLEGLPKPIKPGILKSPQGPEKRIDPEFLKKYRCSPGGPDPKVVLYNFTRQIFLSDNLKTKREQLFKHFMHYIHIQNLKNINVEQNGIRVIGVIICRDSPEKGGSRSSGINKSLDIYQETVSLEYYPGGNKVMSIKNSFVNEQRIALNDIKIFRDPNEREFTLDQNWLLHVDEYLFRDLNYENGLSELINLSIRNNMIQSVVPSAFQEFKKLAVLNLCSNLIEIVQDDTFNELTNLISLDLSNNLIAHIQLKAFNGLENLKILNLRCNRLSKLDFRKNASDQSSIFQNLKNLEYLDISENNIRDLSTNSRLFADLTSLVDLNLSMNHIKILSQNSFVPLKNLECLNLGFNYLSFVEKSQKDTFAMLKKLKYLFLNNNRLIFLDDYYFESLGKLRYLFLHSNQIAFVGANTFNHMAVEDENKSGDLPFSELRALTLYDNPEVKRSDFKLRRLINWNLFKKSCLSKFLILEKNNSQIVALLEDQRAVEHRRSIDFALNRASR
jgi:Leucine-rich repeat (LRR) protein